MSLLTRDEILDAHANCNGKCNSFYMPCPLNNIDCEIAVREAIKSLRDDHNAEVKKNKRLESELAKVAAERDAEWLNFIGDYSTAKCSTCGELYDVSEYQDKEHFNAFKSFYKFCPNCGANMDVEDKP